MRPGSIPGRCTVAAVLLAALFIQGCGTLFYGASQRIPVTSSPPGATVFVDGKRVAFAPCLLRLKRKSAQTIRIEKEGYDPAVIEVSRSRGRQSTVGIVLFDIIGGAAVGYLVGRLVGTALASEEVPHNVNESRWVVTGPVIGMILVVPIAVAVDLGNRPQYRLTPSAIEVTLTKTEGTPRTSVVNIDADDLERVRWIRVEVTSRRAPASGGR